MGKVIPLRVPSQPEWLVSESDTISRADPILPINIPSPTRHLPAPLDPWNGLAELGHGITATDRDVERMMEELSVQATQSLFDEANDVPPYAVQAMLGLQSLSKSLPSNRTAFYSAAADMLKLDMGALFVLVDVSHGTIPPSIFWNKYRCTTLVEAFGSPEDETFFRQAREEGNFIFREGDQARRVLPYSGRELSLLEGRVGRDRALRMGKFKYPITYKPNGHEYPVGSISVHGFPAGGLATTTNLTAIAGTIDSILQGDLKLLNMAAVAEIEARNKYQR
ncbi:hypothetical protein HYU19_03595 [Candidatus Woesearchaeota archaeon]|nr:hypothetical protein [Candidatus Woesearchaeota archaeon]